MFKKVGVILATVIFLSLSLKFALSAQKYSGEDANLSGFTERFNRIETRLDALAKNSEAGNSANKEITRKLDLILSNQEKILSELGIVKVRASKR